jgi:hypothetical protein
MPEHLPTPDFVSFRPLGADDADPFDLCLQQLPNYEPGRPYFDETIELTGANRLAPQDMRPQRVIVADLIYGDSEGANSHRECCKGTISGMTGFMTLIGRLAVLPEASNMGIGLGLLQNMYGRLDQEAWGKYPQPIELYVEAGSDEQAPIADRSRELLELYKKAGAEETFLSRWMAIPRLIYPESQRILEQKHPVKPIRFDKPNGTLDQQAKAAFTHLWGILTDTWHNQHLYHSKQQHTDDLHAILQKHGDPALQSLGISDRERAPLHLYGDNDVATSQGYMPAMVLDEGDVPKLGIKQWAAIKPARNIDASDIHGQLLRQLITESPGQWSKPDGYYVAAIEDELRPFRIDCVDDRTYKIGEMGDKETAILLGELVLGAEKAGLQATPNRYMTEEWIEPYSTLLNKRKMMADFIRSLHRAPA